MCRDIAGAALNAFASQPLPRGLLQALRAGTIVAGARTQSRVVLTMAVPPVDNCFEELGEAVKPSIF